MHRHAMWLLSLIGLACATSSGDSGSSVGNDESTTEVGDGGGPECGATNCASDEFCDWGNNQCAEGGPGAPVCRAIPMDCDIPDNPDFTVCGCDGEVYESICEANAAGTDIGEDTCEPPAGMFGCGWKLCMLETEVCEYTPNLQGGAATWSCDPTPPECAADYSCACIQPIYDQSGCSYTNCTDDAGVWILCGQADG